MCEKEQSVHHKSADHFDQMVLRIDLWSYVSYTTYIQSACKYFARKGFERVGGRLADIKTEFIFQCAENKHRSN